MQGLNICKTMTLHHLTTPQTFVHKMKYHLYMGGASHKSSPKRNKISSFNLLHILY